MNQTFQFNNTTAASHVPTTPLFIDALPSVSNAVISLTDKSRHRDVGVQKNLNFTRHTPTIRPSEDPSSCITRLEAENRDLRGQAETYKRECEGLRESLGEIKRRYNPSGHHHHPPTLGGPSNFTSHPPPEFSVHPRWRTRNIVADNQLQATDLEEPDYPPIETLPLLTPSSRESLSPSRRRRTPTAPRSFGKAAGSQVQPYFGPQQQRRRRGPSDPTNGRRVRDRYQKLGSLELNGRLGGGPVASSSTTTGEAEASGTSSTIDVDHDKGWW